MNLNSEIYKVKVIIQRYFVESKKQFLHYGDCDIYAARRPYCGCGLLHQLRYLDFNLAEILYPKYGDELYYQDMGNRKKKKSKKDIAEAMKLLESVFGKAQKPSLEELKMDYDDVKKLLDTLFTKRMFPGGFTRLDKWLREEVKKD